MPRYFLAPHSYACEVGGYAVFLDLRRDRYSAVSPSDLSALRTAVEGWPTSPIAGSEATASTPIDERDKASPTSVRRSDAIEALVEEGLLTADVSGGKLATPPQLEVPTTSLWEFPRPWPHIGPSHLRQFLAAWVLTTLRLRTMPIGQVVNRLRRIGLQDRRNNAPFDIGRVRHLVSVHLALQPAFYSAEGACLRNSLTMLAFLAKHDVHPTCVFGVRMEPFSAHAWLQHGRIVLTDPVEHVRRFVPIMLV